MLIDGQGNERREKRPDMAGLHEGGMPICAKADVSVNQKISSIQRSNMPRACSNIGSFGSAASFWTKPVMGNRPSQYIVL